MSTIRTAACAAAILDGGLLKIGYPYGNFLAVIGLLLWLLLLVVCWPLALVALLLWPLIWLISLPFRLVGIAVEGVFELLRAVILLPARLLGGARH